MKVREVVRLLEERGWVEMRRRGSHRHFKHPEQPWVITVPKPPYLDPHQVPNRTIEEGVSYSLAEDGASAGKAANARLRDCV